LKSNIFWDVKPWSLAEIYWCFRGKLLAPFPSKIVARKTRKGTGTWTERTHLCDSYFGPLPVWSHCQQQDQERGHSCGSENYFGPVSSLTQCLM